MFWSFVENGDTIIILLNIPQNMNKDSMDAHRDIDAV